MEKKLAELNAQMKSQSDLIVHLQQQLQQDQVAYLRMEGAKIALEELIAEAKKEDTGKTDQNDARDPHAFGPVYPAHGEPTPV